MWIENEQIDVVRGQIMYAKEMQTALSQDFIEKQYKETLYKDLINELIDNNLIKIEREETPDFVKLKVLLKVIKPEPKSE